MTAGRDDLHRTVKLEIDSGAAETVEEAWALLRSYVLQVSVNPELLRNRSACAALMTIINAGCRAFLGGVRVQMPRDVTVEWPLLGTSTATEVVATLGGTLVDTTTEDHPTVVLGDHSSRGSVVIYPTWDGWAAGVVCEPASRLPGRAFFPPAGVAAGALAVSESFQHVRGLPTAGRRDVGISLWEPDSDWLSEDAVGLRLEVAPKGWWLLGLGHLGQAYAWTCALLPYVDPSEVMFLLQDDDRVVEANLSTSLLAVPSSMGMLKTRVVASVLERAGFGTRLVERRFDELCRPQASEPAWALGGFDAPEPRRHLGVFGAAFDGGLGSGPTDYLELVVHAFPSETPASDAFPVTKAGGTRSAPAYERLVAEAIGRGATEGEARCGVVDIAGVSVGAAFVGAFTAAVVVAEAARTLIDGPRFEIVSLSLRDPQLISTARAMVPTPPNPGFAPLL